MFSNKILIFLVVVNSGAFSEPGKFILGGIFDENHEDEAAFNLAVQLVNLGREPDSLFSSVTKTLSSGGPFQALTSTCSFLNEQVLAVFGPKVLDNIRAVESVCDTKDIPHIITRPIFRTEDYQASINFYPNPKMLALAYLDIVLNWGWRSFTILYEDNNSLLRLSELIKRAKDSGLFVTIRKLDEEGDGIYRTTLKNVRDSQESRFVIDCKVESLEQVLLQAQQVGLMTNLYKYLITNLDTQTIDMSPFQHCEANITGIRIFDPNSHVTTELLASLEDLGTELEIPEAQTIKAETALLFDAVAVVSKAIQEVATIESFNLEEVRCDTPNSFTFGTTITNYIRGIDYSGLTGIAKFDNQGQRSIFDLDIIELLEEGFVKIGTWNYTKGLSTQRKSLNDIVEDPESLRNKTFIVITCLTDPYGMLKETPVQMYGNDRFEGFGIDLIQELAQMEGFNYTFVIRHDKKTGNKDPATGKWSGMIGDLMEYRADLAITDLTITADRESAVDFTSPFMSLGISILAKKPGKAPPSFFSFADPFAIDTWTMLALAYVVVTLALFVMGRLCPDEWTNPYPCIEEPEFFINQFSLQNSGWFTIGSLMQQGTEIAPIAVSTRMVAGMWWFFVLIMVSSYTANLAAFLTTENPINLFTDIQTLVENVEKHDIRIGAKANGATASFFQDKKDETYSAIAKLMEDHPENMVKENKDGVAFAENSTYAFFMESISIEYETQRHCNLQQYGGLLDDKGYGIAMRKNSTYRKKLSMAILKLQSSGEMDKLKRKWWEERKGGGQCSGDSDSQAATPLDLKNVEGVFYVTIGGVVCSVFSVILEMIVSTLKISIRAKMPFRECLKGEMKSYLNFSSDVKPTFNESSESSEKKSESPKGSADVDENAKPEPYGFIGAVSKERLTNSS